MVDLWMDRWIKKNAGICHLMMKFSIISISSEDQTGKKQKEQEEGKGKDKGRKGRPTLIFSSKVKKCQFYTLRLLPRMFTLHLLFNLIYISIKKRKCSSKLLATTCKLVHISTVHVYIKDTGKKGSLPYIVIKKGNFQWFEQLLKFFNLH